MRKPQPAPPQISDQDFIGGILGEFDEPQTKPDKLDPDKRCVVSTTALNRLLEEWAEAERGDDVPFCPE